MQKWMILPLGVLLSSCLCAAAQAPETQRFPIPEPSAPMTMWVRAQARPSAPPAQPVGFNALLALAKNPNQGLKRVLSIQVSRTMFATESRVPIAQLTGGRLQLDGFASTHNLGNILLDPWGLGHPGIRVPHSDHVYGIRLSFRLGRDVQTARFADGWRRLASVLGAGRDERVQQ